MFFYIFLYIYIYICKYFILGQGTHLEELPHGQPQVVSSYPLKPNFYIK